MIKRTYNVFIYCGRLTTTVWPVLFRMGGCSSLLSNELHRFLLVIFDWLLCISGLCLHAHTEARHLRKTNPPKTSVPRNEVVYNVADFHL